MQNSYHYISLMLPAHNWPVEIAGNGNGLCKLRN